MTYANPMCSTIICTKYRKAVLIRCLEHVLQDIVSFENSYEVIVVCSKETARYTYYHLNTHFLRLLGSQKLRIVIQDGSGLPNARNCGLRHAKGKIVLFLDDDAMVRPGYFNELKKMFANDEGLGGLSGPVHSTVELPKKLRGIKQAFDKVLIAHGGKDTPPIARVFYNGVNICFFERATIPTEVDRLSGCNMAYSKTAIESVAISTKIMLAVWEHMKMPIIVIELN